MDDDYGNVSRAMRNRSVELYLLPDDCAWFKISQDLVVCVSCLSLLLTKKIWSVFFGNFQLQNKTISWFLEKNFSFFCNSRYTLFFNTLFAFPSQFFFQEYGNEYGKPRYFTNYTSNNAGM